uniref:protein CHUP1, chloroplastic n=1 Tax=Erigeron canadensis TaxID=72917 RepID=UPI001CB96A84|nr:protein CHUP1, chloroplastic [Erigeron canadensis]
MESKGSKELIKSILIMAGIPIAFSVACSLIARIKDRKNAKSYQVQINESGFYGDEEDYIENAHDPNHLKEHISSLKSKILELQELEKEIEVRFFRFIDLKDQEYALMEIQNSLCMEKERAEFMKREASSIEAENKKFDEMVMEYLKAVGELETLRLENGLLQRREKKLLKKSRESSRLIKKQKLKIEAQEAQMLINEADSKRKEIVIEGFEHEVEEIRGVINALLDEKNEVLHKLEIAENSLSFKIEAERILKENHNQAVKELENLKKDRAGELKELIYLRWCHACLKHELARRNQIEQERKAEENRVDDHELGLVEDIAPEECIAHESDNESVVCNVEPFFKSGQRHRKRRWLARKFRKWVEGNEKHHDTKCFGSHSVVDETEEPHSAGRKSFSSV